MAREEIGEGVRVGDRCANTGPSMKVVSTTEVLSALLEREYGITDAAKRLSFGERNGIEYLKHCGRFASFVVHDLSNNPWVTHTVRSVTTPRRALTIEEAERGDIPKPYGKKDDDYGHEWGAMLKASCVPAPNRT